MGQQAEPGYGLDMFRKPVAFLVTLYAIAFAFAAMTMVRWPTLMTAITFAFKDQSVDLAGFDWRGVGVYFGLPFIAAAVFFQISAFAIATKSHGALTAFVFGVLTGFPPTFIFDLQPYWLQDSGMTQTTVYWFGGATLLLLAAVWDLRRRPPPPPEREQPPEPVAYEPSAGYPRLVMAAGPMPEARYREPRARRPRPVPIYVRRQRALWAEQARRERARKTRWVEPADEALFDEDE